MKERSICGFSFLGWIGIFTLAFSSCAVKADFANQPVTEPKTVLRLELGENNPRNSEGDFVKLKDGKLLFIYTHYYGKEGADHSPAYLASRYSEDGGKTWSQEDEIVIPNEGDMNVRSVSLLRLRSGEIALFYLHHNSREDASPMMRLSTDEAVTWSDPIDCITDTTGYFVVNNDRVVQLSSGRLLMPVSLHNVPGGEWNSKGIIYCYFSDDEGRHWQRSGMVPLLESATFQEPGIVELSDHSILMFIRSNMGTQNFSKSVDEGVSWTKVEKSQLISPLSPASIERIPSTGDLVAVWNNNLSTDQRISKLRTPLNIAISKDEGVSWERTKTLEADILGWYCYTAIHFVDNKLLLSYCAGKQATGGLNDTSIKSVDLSWIYNENK